MHRSLLLGSSSTLREHSWQGILGFFSGLERIAADEIERFAENTVYTEEEEKVVTRKIDFRLLPIIVLRCAESQSLGERSKKQKDISLFLLLATSVSVCHVAHFFVIY